MKKFGLFVLSSFVTASASAQILNGGFEDGASGIADNWTQVGAAVPIPYSDYVNGAGATGSGPGLRGLVFNGGEVAGGSRLSQFITTVPGLAYDVTFVYGNFGVSTTQALNFAAIDQTTTDILATGLWIDGTGATDFGEILQAGSVSFTATGTSTEIVFSDAGSVTNSSDLFLDAVVVTPVPEPASMAVLGFGLAALKRRRAARK